MVLPCHSRERVRFVVSLVSSLNSEWDSRFFLFGSHGQCTLVGTISSAYFALVPPLFSSPTCIFPNLLLILHSFFSALQSSAYFPCLISFPKFHTPAHSTANTAGFLYSSLFQDPHVHLGLLTYILLLLLQIFVPVCLSRHLIPVLAFNTSSSFCVLEKCHLYLLLSCSVTQ